MKNNIQSILNDLYKTDPDLKKQEKELKILIKKMLEVKPDAKPDAAFIRQLRIELNERAAELSSPESGRAIWRYVFSAFGGAAVMAAIFLSFSHFPMQFAKEKVSFMAPRTADIDENGFPEEDGEWQMESFKEHAGMDKAEDEAFGPLVLNSQAVKTQSATTGRGGGGYAVDTEESKIILPPGYEPINYRYEFDGDLQMPEEDKLAVYKRENAYSDSTKLVSFLRSFDFGGIDIKKFSDLKIMNIGLSEENKFGYIINIDFTSGVISISENSRYWESPRTKCGDDRVCFENMRLKLSDIPSDKNLIAIADKFLKQHDIDVSGYGLPEIQKYWEEQMADGSSEEDIYVMETVQIIYPELVDGIPVLEDWGNKSGLNVTVNLYHSRVSGIWNLRVSNFTSSLYEAEKDEDAVRQQLEKGGRHYPYFEDAKKTVTIPVGAPEKVWMKVYQYKEEEGQSEELLVPSLAFPVTGRPDEVRYDNRKAVLVPLVKGAVTQNYPVAVPLLERSSGTVKE